MWANLPKSHKMMEPRYRDIKSAQVPEVRLENGVTVKVIAGKINDREGPVKGIINTPSISMWLFLQGLSSGTQPSPVIPCSLMSLKVRGVLMRKRSD